MHASVALLTPAYPHLYLRAAALGGAVMIAAKQKLFNCFFHPYLDSHIKALMPLRVNPTGTLLRTYHACWLSNCFNY